MEVFAKVILLTRDEVDMIQDFVHFYGFLFGYENVIIVDNNSCEPYVLYLYKQFIKKGVTIIKETRSFKDAHYFMTEHILRLKGTCKFVFPLETDEFLFLPKTDVMTTKKILSVLLNIPEDVSIIRYGAFLGSIVDTSDESYANNCYSNPARQIKKFYNQDWDKIIIRMSTFEKMTLWCHKAKCNSGTQITCHDIGLLHFHDYGFIKKIQRSIPVIKEYQYVDFNNPLSDQLCNANKYKHGICGHKLVYYIILLKRMIVCKLFNDFVKRNPTIDELLRYTNYPDNNTISKIFFQDLEILTHKIIDNGINTNDLLYFEEEYESENEKKCNAQIVTQLIDFFDHNNVAYPLFQDIYLKYFLKHSENHHIDEGHMYRHIYMNIYEKYFKPHKTQQINILEINNVDEGHASIALCEYFTNAYVTRIGINTLASTHPRLQNKSENDVGCDLFNIIIGCHEERYLNLLNRKSTNVICIFDSSKYSSNDIHNMSRTHNLLLKVFDTICIFHNNYLSNY